MVSGWPLVRMVRSPRLRWWVFLLLGKNNPLLLPNGNRRKQPIILIDYFNRNDSLIQPKKKKTMLQAIISGEIPQI